MAVKLIIGVGTGVGAAIFADIARATTTEERTGFMSVFMGIRQLGMLAGICGSLALLSKML